MRAALDLAEAHRQRCEDSLESPWLTGKERQWMEAEALRMAEAAEKISRWLD